MELPAGVVAADAANGDAEHRRAFECFGEAINYRLHAFGERPHGGAASRRAGGVSPLLMSEEGADAPRLPRLETAEQQAAVAILEGYQAGEACAGAQDV